MKDNIYIKSNVVFYIVVLIYLIISSATVIYAIYLDPRFTFGNIIITCIYSILSYLLIHYFYIIFINEKIFFYNDYLIYIKKSYWPRKPIKNKILYSEIKEIFLDNSWYIINYQGQRVFIKKNLFNNEDLHANLEKIKTVIINK